uniref:Stellacyanin-like protein CASLP1 n=1 Tax=Capsicum annuum TaxID=4072 RepID=Q9FYT2_CAPAN|nr:stellacyanin-like protein CASLP1 precursor [Capsicum annuum]
MEKMLCMIVFGALAIASLAQDASAQTVHVVGDNTGWVIPSNGAAAYTNWADRKTFRVGDTLVFNFTTNQHDVLQVQKSSFDGCNSQNAVSGPILGRTSKYNTQLHLEITTIISTFGRHCLNGQKLAIRVSSSTSTPGANPPTSSAAGPSGSVPGGTDAGPSGSVPGGTAPPPPSSSTTRI